jgi:16S rRNA (guanine527-N7)-methyltransferase
MTMSTNSFESLLQGKGILLTDEKLELFQLYYETLVEWNEKMNLTAITDREEVFLKHFYDSITLSFHFDVSKVESIADIGSGAGFPSLPLKIVFPHLKVTIVDSLNKRITFLKHLVEQLGLKDVNLVHGRAEDLGNQPAFRDRFDLVTARAVARLNVLSEFCLPFCRVGGHFIAMKGAKAEEEVSEASKAIRTLGGRLVDAPSFSLPLETSHRQIIIIHKEKPTPKAYPRKAGLPAKSPIV